MLALVAEKLEVAAEVPGRLGAFEMAHLQEQDHAECIVQTHRHPARVECDDRLAIDEQHCRAAIAPIDPERSFLEDDVAHDAPASLPDSTSERTRVVSRRPARDSCHSDLSAGSGASR